jgi:hypothetical protein
MSARCLSWWKSHAIITCICNIITLTTQLQTGILTLEPPHCISHRLPLHFISIIYCTDYCIVLYCTVLYCAVSGGGGIFLFHPHYSTLLYSTLLYSTLLYSTTLFPEVLSDHQTSKILFSKVLR